MIIGYRIQCKLYTPTPSDASCSWLGLLVSGAILSLILYLIFCLLLSGDVELNPGPTIDDRPDVSLLIQWLDPLVDWIPFAYCLPEMTHSDISKIQAENKKVDDQKLALYSKWLDIIPNATWKDVITALNTRREYKLVQNVKKNLQETLLIAATREPHATKVVITFDTAENEKEVLCKIIDLYRSFSSLTMHIRSGLDQKNETDPKLLVNLTRWLETYMNWNDKLTNVSLDEIFKIIHPHYDFINCSLIVDICEVFLGDIRYSTIVYDLHEYKVEVDLLYASSNVCQLRTALEEIYDEHLPDISNMPTILIKLHNAWQASSINGLSVLIHNLLPVGLQQSLMMYITIRSGSGFVDKAFIGPDTTAGKFLGKY